MNEHERQTDRMRIALQERPYDLGVVPDAGFLEYIDPRNETVDTERWTPVLERLGGSRQVFPAAA